MVHIWNNLDNTLKTAKSISTFKFYLKNKLITDFLNGTSWLYVTTFWYLLYDELYVLWLLFNVYLLSQ